MMPSRKTGTIRAVRTFPFLFLSSLSLLLRRAMARGLDRPGRSVVLATRSQHSRRHRGIFMARRRSIIGNNDNMGLLQ